MAEDDPTSVLMFGMRGRCGPDIPFAAPPDQCEEAINIDFFRSTCGRKRQGCFALPQTGLTTSGIIASIFSHVPSADQTAREMWAVDDGVSASFGRLVGGTVWTNITLKDGHNGTDAAYIHAATMNGKLYFAYHAAGVNRLHVWDPVGTTVRRVGLGKTNAPAVANGGAGTLSFTRFYRVRVSLLVAGVVQYRSEPSPQNSIQITLQTGVTVTKPTSLPGEGETHWEVEYALTTNGPWRQAAQLTVATASYSDTASAIDTTLPLTELSGTFVCPPSAKYIVADDSRIIMAAGWETTTGDGMTPSPRRVWWTSPLGATDHGDDERVSNTSAIKSYLDVDESITALSPPVQGSLYIFSYNCQWKMVYTGVPGAPYIRYRINGSKGCIEAKTIVMADDEVGNPCMYWMSPQGPMRKGPAGDATLVDDVQDIWDTVNLGATTIVGHGVYHRDKHQIWWWLATGSANTPNLVLVFDTRLGQLITQGTVRKGFTEFTGVITTQIASVMMSNTIGASMSKDLKPYVSGSATVGRVLMKCDAVGAVQDNGTSFQAYIRSRIYTPWGVGMVGGMQEEATVAAKAAANVTLTLTMIRDFGMETSFSTVLLDPEAAETRVVKLAEGSRIAQCSALQMQIGDSGALQQTWNIDLVQAPLIEEGRG